MPETTDAVPLPSQRAFPGWLRFFAFFPRTLKGWNYFLVLPFVALASTAVSLPIALTYELCEDRVGFMSDAVASCMSSQGGMLGVLEALAGLTILLTFLILAGAFAWHGHRGRVKRLQRGYHERIQRLRDHIITGAATPETFDQVQALWKPLVRGEHKAVPARAGASTAVVFTSLVSLAFAIGLTIFAIGAIVVGMEQKNGNGSGDEQEFLTIWYGIFVPLLSVFGITLLAGWIFGPRMLGETSQAFNQAVDEAERDEIRILAGATPTTKARRTAVAAAGPSFRAYTDRTSVE